MFQHYCIYSSQQSYEMATDSSLCTDGENKAKNVKPLNQDFLLLKLSIIEPQIL